MLRYQIAVAMKCLCGIAVGAVLLTGCSSGEQSDEFQSFDSLDPQNAADTQSPASPDAGTALADVADNQTAGDTTTASTDNPAAQSGTDSDTPASQPETPTPQPKAGKTTATDQAATPQTQPASKSPDTPPAEQPVAQAGPGSAQPGDSESTAKPREIKLLVPNREFQAEGPQKSLRVTYDDIDLLKVLNMEPVTPNAAELMPAWLRSLNNRRILIRGFMYPTFKETGLQAFILARDNQICCFGRDPKIYDLVRISLRKGVTSDYIQGRPFDVEGVFHIKPESEDDELFRLYSIDDAVVIDR